VTSCRIKGGGSSYEGSAKQFSDDVLNHFTIECREQSGELFVSGVTSGREHASRLVTACRWHGRRSGRLPRSCRTGIRCSCRVSHDDSSSIVAASTSTLIQMRLLPSRTNWVFCALLKTSLYVAPEVHEVRRQLRQLQRQLSSDSPRGQTQSSTEVSHEILLRPFRTSDLVTPTRSAISFVRYARPRWLMTIDFDICPRHICDA
jgi:hypothetical protein